MLPKEARAIVADNSGAQNVLIFGILGGSKKKTAYIGDIVRVAVKKTLPNNKIVKKGDVRLALVVRTKFKKRDKFGHMAEAGDNAVVLLGNNYKPLFTRISGFAARKAFKGQFEPLASMIDTGY